MQLAKAVVAALGIVALSYFTVASIEHSMTSHDRSPTFTGTGTPATTEGAPGSPAPRVFAETVSPATLPDISYVPRYPSTATPSDEQPATF